MPHAIETRDNFIDGKPAPAATDAVVDVVDPCTGEVRARTCASGPAEVEEAMRAAERAFVSWRRTLPAERQEALLALADALRARTAEFAEAELRDTGSAAAAGEVPLMVDQLRFFAGAARLLNGTAAGEYAADHTSYVRREPVGVCAQLAPWNFPLLMAVLKSAPAIAAGNTVVLKPAPSTPTSALLLAELAAQFLPPGVLNVICGGDDTGRLMVEHPVPAMVSLTGSVGAGREVARSAADGLKRLHLELGGKTPVIVCADADLDAAVETIITGGFANSGQDCTAASRVLAADEVYDEFTERLAEAASAVRTGPPSDEGALYGPLNNADQLERVSGFLHRLPEHARVLTGGHRVGDSGYFFAPTVVADVRQDDEITHEEVFGPVITVQRFTDEEEAIRLANGVSKGLASAVWTRDGARALRLSQALDHGCVWINTHLGFPSEMPHGGFKDSGYGKDLSAYGFEAYTRIKHVMQRF
ncbi:aminobutyraldehyde dehydrogenase [Streptomyces sp. NPDC048278]|uniref:aminobutyraldehyde dehydrogenase n=1 Tax=Streptomyces sp. NPDC048278 TaxID=3155809 RepID=UPI00342890A0